MLANGRFEVSLLRAGGRGDEFFRRALAAGRLDEVLGSLERELHCPRRKNLAMDHFPEWWFSWIFSGGNVGNPYQRNGVGSAGLASILLQTTDSDPTYTESTGEIYTNHHNVQNTANGSTGGKRFISDDIEAERIVVWADAHENRFEVFDRESILFRSRWLYLPSQGISNNVRSLGYHFSDIVTSTSSRYRGNLGRIRLRDERGRKVIINKTADHVLFVELELELVTV